MNAKKFAVNCNKCKEDFELELSCFRFFQSGLSAVKYKDTEEGQKAKERNEEKFRKGSFIFDCPHCDKGKDFPNLVNINRVSHEMFDEEEKESIKNNGKRSFRICE